MRHAQWLLMISLALSLSIAQHSSAALIFGNPITGNNPSLANPLTDGQIVNPNVTVSGIGRGMGINPFTGANRYNASGWNTADIDLTAYFTLSITPNSGFQIDFTEFVYTGERSLTGPTSFAFRSSVDAFSSNIGTPSATGATISLTDIAFQGVTNSIEFRLYGWGASSGAGTFSVNDFSFNGTVSPVSAIPEPSSLAVVGLLVVGGGFRTFRLRKHRAKADSAAECH